ncbi:MAG: hypothetical protein IT236_10625 [Bacteroidia bacterium]|nr:hypothetical protein [Bacteroidia bacterium]
MNKVLVIITLAEGAIEKIKSNPELPKKEMEFINQWKEEGVLENFFITVSKTGAVLIFNGISESHSKQLIESLPYFPFMARVDYLNLDKHF